jgi:hypothetical protein
MKTTSTHGTRRFTQELLDSERFPKLVFRIATYKQPGEIISNFQTFTYSGGFEQFAKFTNIMQEIERTSHKHVLQVNIERQHERVLRNWDMYKEKALAYHIKKLDQRDRNRREREMRRAREDEELLAALNSPQGVVVPTPSHAEGTMTYSRAAADWGAVPRTLADLAGIAPTPGFVFMQNHTPPTLYSAIEEMPSSIDEFNDQ